MHRLQADAGAASLRAVPGVTLATAAGGCSGIQTVTNPRSTDASLIADLWWAMLIGGTVVLAAVLVLLAVAVLRTVRGRPQATPGRRFGWGLVIAGGVIAPLTASLAAVVSGVQIGRTIVAHPSEPAVTVEVVGRRWWWEVRYLGDDGETIAVTANEIHVPVDRPVRFRLVSDNVIHSFWVPNLQGKTDMIPGQVNESWIEAEEVGIFRGQCAEFCGTQHALMAFLVIAEPQEDFEAWLEMQASPAVTPEEPLLVRGRDVFMETACRACHTIRGTPATGTLGPDLTHVGARRTLAAVTIPNTRGHLGGWIADPQNIKPGSLMPPTPLAPQDLRALLAYLESLR